MNNYNLWYDLCRLRIRFTHNVQIMRIVNSLVFIFLSALLFTSCSVSRYIAPPFTDVTKIIELKPGQGVEEVSATLKVEPYDIVHSLDDGKMILIYNYRAKDRNMGLPTRSAQMIIHTEESQRGGETWYNLDYRELYVLFVDGKLKNVYSDNLLSDGQYFASYSDSLSINTGTSTDLGFVQGVYQQRIKSELRLDEDKRLKRRRNWFIVGIVGAGLLAINTITRIFNPN